MNAKRKWTLIAVLFLACSFLLTTGYVLAKYTITWEKGFGLHIYPKKDAYVLTTGSSLNAVLPSDVQRIVFGKTSDYSVEIKDVTAVHVGNEDADLVYLYYVDATETAYILAKKEIVFHADSAEMFKGLSSVQSITFDHLTTENVTTMRSMFYGCTALPLLDITVFDTSSVTDTGSMFEGCETLETVFAGVSFDTSSVTSSENMFLSAYLLVGGNGTRVYPVGETETEQPLDKTYAWPDGVEGKKGYFTDKSQTLFFRSNLLRPIGEGQTYAVNGTSAWFTVANGLDSSTVSKDTVSYTVSYYIDRDGAWELAQTETGTLSGGVFQKKTHTVALITVEGETFDHVRVVATAVGADRALEAEFDFDASPIEVSYALEENVVRMTVFTKDQSGSFTFGWKNGVLPDASDPNGILQAADPSVYTLDATLNAYTVYEFCFMISDASLFDQVKADPETQMPLTVWVE